MEATRLFGRLDDGRDVHAHHLRGDGGVSAQVLDLGGILARLTVPAVDGPADIILGLDDANAYFTDPAYLGVLVGRYGNRIGGARFAMDGQEHRLQANEGRNHLHGGRLGFGRRLWEVVGRTPAELALRYHSPDGEEGYPGNLEVRATYRVEGAALRLVFEAGTDAPTPFNPTHHPYFNLAGDPAVPASEQLLQVPVTGFLPVADDLIPLGEVASAAGTAFDFRAPARLDAQLALGHSQVRLAGGFDHCLVLEPGRRFSAALYSPHSGVAMRIDCDAPALQLYGGQGLATQHPGLGHGLCLEPQDFPDAPNQPRFPDAVLRPGTAYRREIIYRFACPGRERPWDEVAAALDPA